MMFLKLFRQWRRWDTPRMRVVLGVVVIAVIALNGMILWRWIVSIKSDVVAVSWSDFSVPEHDVVVALPGSPSSTTKQIEVQGQLLPLVRYDSATTEALYIVSVITYSRNVNINQPEERLTYMLSQITDQTGSTLISSSTGQMGKYPFVDYVLNDQANQLNSRYRTVLINRQLVTYGRTASQPILPTDDKFFNSLRSL